MNIKPKIKTLSNGMRLITLSMPQWRSVTVLLMVKVGSRYEEETMTGISHFLEHMVFKGTKKYPTAFDLTSAVDSIGAEFNAFTAKEYTGFYVKSAVNHLPLALDVLAEMVWHPLLKEKEINREKRVIIEEINMREDTPMVKVGEVFETLLYGLTPLGRETIGYKKTVKAVKRKDFVDYRQQWYQPERMVMGIVGGIERFKSSKSKVKSLVQNLVQKYFSKNYPNSDTTVIQLGKKLKADKLEKLKFSQKKPAIRVRYKKTEQAHLCLGVRAFPRGHKDRYVMSVLTTILGGNMSSRLFTEVREKRGLTYYIKSDINTYFDNGYLVSQAGTDINKAKETIKVILEEYKKISNSKFPVSNEELKRAKEYLKGKLALALEDSKEVASFFVEDFLLEGKIRLIKEIIAGIEKVTLADLKRVAKEIFVNQGLNLAIIGPYKDKEKFAKLLKL